MRFILTIFLSSLYCVFFCRSSQRQTS